jgi:hypothetical protein
MDGLFVAAAVVAVVQFGRLRDRRLVPLALMMAFLAGAEAREGWDPWRRRFQVAALASGLALLALLSAGDEAARRAPGRGGRA